MAIAREARVRRMAILIVGGVVVVLGVGLPVRWLEERHQREMQRQAREYADRMQPLLATDGRFWRVGIKEFSGYGCVRLNGSVKSGEDLTGLHKFIEKTPPPDGVDVRWRVQIEPGKTGWFERGE